MANGLPVLDSQPLVKTATEFKAPNNFTSFSGDTLRDAQVTISRPPESGAVTLTEPPRDREDPTVTMSDKDKALTDQLMAQIMEKPKSSKPQEVVKQIEKNTLKEVKKPQGFWAKIKETIENFFRKFFR